MKQNVENAKNFAFQGTNFARNASQSASDAESPSCLQDRRRDDALSAKTRCELCSIEVSTIRMRGDICEFCNLDHYG